MACASLIVANHTDNVEILSRVDLVVGLSLSCLMDDALANVGKQLPRNGVGDRTVTWRLLEANGVVETGQVAGSGAHLKLFKVERLNLAD